MKYVFFLNMGGVNDPLDCEVFLKNMFNDPNILTIKSKFLRKIISFIIRKTRIKQMMENYKRIGGKSPLTHLQYVLCSKLNKMQEQYHFDFISLYVSPFADEVLSKYSFSKSDEIILFPLYPHYSTTTVKSSLENFYKHFTQKIKIRKVKVFFKDKNYNKVIFNTIAKQKKCDILIVSAHSLPQKIVDNGDVYEQQINAHFEIIKRKFQNQFSKIILAYQSKLGPVKWLGPSLDEVLKNNVDKSVLIYPISFCIDCSETVFELNVEYREKYPNITVCRCPNHSQEFCDFILKKVKQVS